MSKIGHKAILASAGSGKTFQLAHRYIRLLAETDPAGGTVTPDRICAMTFTRKAAGEIFDGIAEYLCKAASDDTNAALTSKRIDRPDLKREDYLVLLRRFMDDLHRSRIGTFDSFIVGIAKAFPVELDIPMSFQVMDTGGAAAEENRQKILDHILGSSNSNAVGKTFLEAFKQATFGHEEKTIDKVLEDFITKMSLQYRLCPDGSKWGNADLIWPAGTCPYQAAVECDAGAVLKNVRAWHSDQDLTQTRAKRVYDTVLDITEQLAVFDPSSSADELLGNALFGQMLENLSHMRSGGFALYYYNRPYELPIEISKGLADLTHNMLFIEYERMLLRTSGLYRLLDTYESVYQLITRASGSFSFSDIQYLLAGSGTGGRYVSREEGVDRLYIDYRMDCRLDHWMLDEFQDTSDLQWGVFENLIEEIIQSESGRSFFYVGDIKQAIYRWRGGNHELFHRILGKYNSPGNKLIEDVSIQKTYRCSQPVIDTINKVFTDLPAEFPEPAIDLWSNKAWNDHETASPEKEKGYVALLDLPSAGRDENAEEMRYQLVSDMLNEMQPLKRGLSVGILVRDNDFGRDMVHYLSRECEGMSFVHEGESGVADNEAAELLLAMIKAAAHPGDEYAWQFIQMTPMSGVLEAKGINRRNVSEKLLTEVLEEGYQSFVRHWAKELQAVCDLGAYGVDCLNRLESAAAEFDAQDKGSGSEVFLRFIDSYTTREQASRGSVRVMTIHQSKGLEFDVVILPQLQAFKNSNMVKPVHPQLICAGGRSEPEWILKAPKKIIAENDSQINDQLLADAAKHSYDSLCVLYVAMTRARHALYMVTSSYRNTPDIMHQSVFIKTQLVGEANPQAQSNMRFNGSECACLYERGMGKDWYTSCSLDEDNAEAEERVQLPDDYSSRCEKSRHLPHKEPSRQGSVFRSASSLFMARSTDIMDFGSAIHEMLQQVEWIEDADAEKIIQEWEPTSAYDPDVTRDAIEQFRKCMESDAVRISLGRPSGKALVWREKRFEVILDGELVSGAFDRVVIIADEKGNPKSAAIIDYKSSLVDSEPKLAEKVRDYTPQMHIYRDALAVILGMPSAEITADLLFTKQQVVKRAEI